MSLTVDGFWKAGFWNTGFWADGFWRESAGAIVDEQGGGTSRKKRIKKKWRTLRRSEYESEVEFKHAVQESIPSIPFSALGDEIDDEDEALLQAITVILSTTYGKYS